MPYWYSNPLLCGRVRNLNRLAKAAAAYNRYGGIWCTDYLYGCVTIKIVLQIKASGFEPTTLRLWGRHYTSAPSVNV